jgi:hypothetical protein
MLLDKFIKFQKLKFSFFIFFCICFLFFSLNEVEATRCATDKDCPEGQQCLSGLCVGGGPGGEEGAPTTGYGLGEAANAAGLKAPSVSSIIGKIISAVLGFVGVIFLILMIYGGFLWMTAGGNEEQVKKARGLIINATIGLIIVIAAYGVVYFVVSQLLTVTAPS